MGTGIIRIAFGAALLTTGCKPASPVANQAEPVAHAAESAAPAPVATSAAVAASPIGQWLVGAWSYDTSCATDFILHYNADGTLQNGEDGGRWALTGDTVSETILERFEMGSDAPIKLDPPEKRSYTVQQIDADKGTLTFQGKKIPILRC
ncbi:MAG: hypothetical protein EON59_07750 [Alphaproteobacteria bacterium]|nr:MAG: hypothetical protein EON59_07750 [Alphaproteobacteria bacterium]